MKLLFINGSIRDALPCAIYLSVSLCLYPGTLSVLIRLLMLNYTTHKNFPLNTTPFLW